MKTKILLSFLLSLNFCLLSSQVPQGFNYQAIARDGSGNPIPGVTMQVKIGILSDTILNTMVWEELFNPVKTNAFGMFTMVVGTGVKQSGSAPSFSAIDWTKTPLYIRTSIYYAGAWKVMGTTKLQSVPYSMVAGSLEGAVPLLSVQGNTTTMDSALFVVRNNTGQIVFAVYNEGVRIYVDDGVAGKGAKGGFAIGGFNKNKGTVENYLVVRPDTFRIYFDDTPGKGAKGGFAIGGFNKTKGSNNNYLNVSTDESGLVNPAQNRILWYPLKNAFLAGRILIENSNDVGENSFATGYESKAKGNYSQAMGYMAVTTGQNSTAIGHNTLAEGLNSFAMGESTRSTGISATSMGSNTWAQSDYSTTMGFNTHTLGKGGTAIGYSTSAAGDYSTAMGTNSTASGGSSCAFGSNNLADGDNSTVMGWMSRSKGWMSTAIGYQDSAMATGSVAMGYISRTFGDFSTAIGAWNTGFGIDAAAIGGYGNEAHGPYSFATGRFSKTFGNDAFASGYSAVASGGESQAFGDGTRANVYGSATFGWLTTTNGTFSVAMGENSTAQARSSLVIGQFNVLAGAQDTWVPSDPAFVIGNGTSDAARSNAFTILKNGSVGIGTASPNFKLDIRSTDANGFALTTGGDSYPTSFAIGRSALEGNLAIAASAGQYAANSAAGDIVLRNMTSTRKLILTTGSGTSAMYLTNGNLYMGNGTAAYCDGNIWHNASDKNLKENFVEADGALVLEKISQLPVLTWNYKSDNRSIRHIGPTAQDFYAKFGLGNDTVSISTIDPAGISLAAIKELNLRNNELKEEVNDLKSQLEKLKMESGRLYSVEKENMAVKQKLEIQQTEIDTLRSELDQIKTLYAKSGTK